MRAVLFDMDGVLLDTERLGRESWLEAARRWGIEDMESFYPACIGRNLADTRDLFTAHYGGRYDYEEFRRFTGRWFQDYIDRQGMPVKAGARQVLEGLKKEGWRMGLVSSTRQERVRQQLGEAGLLSYFSVLVTGDMVEHSKPEPDIYLLGCERLGTRPGETYAVEDSYNGIRSAFRAGLLPVMVPDLIGPDGEMREKCLVICRDLIQAGEFLRGWEPEKAPGQV